MGTPAFSGFIASADVASTPNGLFVGKLSGYFIPEVDGSYVLAISGEQTGALYFSGVGGDSTLGLVASFSAATGRKVWTKHSSQVSKPYSLRAGVRYPFDAFVWDRAAYDYLAVAWAKVNADGSLTPFQIVGGSTVAPRIDTKDPEADQKFYETGYRVGYTDGRYSFPFDLSFPFRDSDGDGLPDNWEIAHGLNPNSDGDALLDHDGDGLYALLEFMIGSNPVAADTDGDGLPDGWEYARGLGVLDATDAASLDPVSGLTFLALYKAETGPKYVLSFTWAPVLVREDGTVIAEDEIATLVVQYGLDGSNLDATYEMPAPEAGAVDVPVTELGTYYVSLLVKDINGIMSEASASIEVSARTVD